MVALYKDHQASIDRTSIRGVRAKKDLYDSLTRRTGDQLPVVKPRLDPNTLHRQSKHDSSIALIIQLPSDCPINQLSHYLIIHFRPSKGLPDKDH